MWMKSRFATWEAEGQVEERIQCALDEGERWRLARIARDAETGHNCSRFLASVSRGLCWLGEHAKGRLAGRAVMVWQNGRADAAAYKPGSARQSRGGEARAEGP